MTGKRLLTQGNLTTIRYHLERYSESLPMQGRADMAGCLHTWLSELLGHTQAQAKDVATLNRALQSWQIQETQWQITKKELCKRLGRLRAACKRVLTTGGQDVDALTVLQMLYDEEVPLEPSPKKH